MVMSGTDGTAETVDRQWVAPGILDTLGIKAVAGRTFQPSDAAARANVVVLSESYWRSRFNADPSVIERIVQLDGEAFTIVGVVPDQFELIGRSSIWALRSFPRVPQARAVYMFRAVGRLNPGVTIDAAAADLRGVAARLAREYPATNADRSVMLEPLHQVLVGGELRLTSLLFLGVVGFVLLVCCANVANLLLARATVRSRELAVRSALGAGRGRVVRQLVTESLVLSLLGGMLGVAVAALILRSAPAFVPEGLLPRAVALSFDWRVVGFCAAAALAVGLLFGLAPAWQATGIPSAQALTSGGRTVTGRGGRIRSLIVASEVAAAVLLLVGAGLLLRTLIALDRVDKGFRAESVLTMMVDPLDGRYPKPADLVRFFDQVEEQTLAQPGVQSVAWASTLPLGPSTAGRSFFEIVGDPPLEANQRPSADYQIVSSGYFRTLDLPILAGRGFDGRDAEDAAPVCIVNEAFVRGHLKGRSPIGMHIAVRSSTQAQPVVREIVGVARQVKGRLDETSELVQIYVPIAQDVIGDIFLLVTPRSGPADALTSSVRYAIGRVDTAQLVSVRNVMTLDQVVGAGTSRHRFRAVLVITFAALALLLAMGGVFGVLAYSVQQHVRDIGVRRALGATTGDVLRLVVGNAAQVVAAGVVVGLLLSGLLSRFLETVLFGVQPLDPVTFTTVVVVLMATAAVSVIGPAWRATRVDPAAALRGD
jgi:putative ABC transport system permease protein